MDDEYIPQQRPAGQPPRGPYWAGNVDGKYDKERVSGRPLPKVDPSRLAPWHPIRMKSKFALPIGQKPIGPIPEPPGSLRSLSAAQVDAWARAQRDWAYQMVTYPESDIYSSDPKVAKDYATRIYKMAQRQGYKYLQ